MAKGSPGKLAKAGEVRKGVARSDQAPEYAMTQALEAKGSVTGNGELAHLGERLFCKQKVASSSLAFSTKFGAIAQSGRAAPLQGEGPGFKSLWLHQIWGYSSVGRALAWHARGPGFEPPFLHHLDSAVLACYAPVI